MTRPGFARALGLAVALALSSGAVSAWSLSGRSSAASEAELLPPEQAFRAEGRIESPTSIVVTLTPAKDYYLYQKRAWFALKAASGASIADVKWLATPEEKDDLTYGKTPVYRQPVRIRLALSAPIKAGQPIELTVGYQGCNEPRGVCYPPQQTVMRLSDQR